MHSLFSRLELQKAVSMEFKELDARRIQSSRSANEDGCNPALPKSDPLVICSLSMLIPLICEICEICVRLLATALKPRHAPRTPQIPNYLDSHGPALFICFICDNAGITKISTVDHDHYLLLFSEYRSILRGE